MILVSWKKLGAELNYFQLDLELLYATSICNLMFRKLLDRIWLLDRAKIVPVSNSALGITMIVHF